MSTDVNEYYDSVIHTECDHADWVEIEEHLKMMKPHDLDIFARILGLTPSERWQDFLGEIQHKTWGELFRAYGAATGHSY